jgi:hypothetical protein
MELRSHSSVTVKAQVPGMELFDEEWQRLLDRMYRNHTLGHCDRDCSWCSELKSRGAKQVAEYRRIEAIKRGRHAKPRGRKRKSKRRHLCATQGRTLEPTGLPRATMTTSRHSKNWLSAPRRQAAPVGGP